MTRGRALDAVVVGGGAAGLSLAAHLAAGGWDDRRVLVVDDPDPLADDRSWGSWSDRPRLVDAAAHRSWDKVEVHAGGRSHVVPLGAYRYRVVRLAALRAHTDRLLAHAPGFEVVPGRVTAVRDGRHCARVDVAGRTLTASWVFDSTGAWTAGLRAAGAVRTPRPGHRMEFTGWRLRTDRDVFDPDRPVLCDFRVPSGGAAFVHVLPDDERSALLEHTCFLAPGAPSPSADAVAADLRAYARGVLGARGVEVLRTERGTICLHPRGPRRQGRRVVAIGACAGLVRASSGYGFDAIQRDAAATVRSLLVHGHPFDVPARPWRHRALDALFLRAVARDGRTLERAFGALFGGDDPVRVLRFLDSDTSLAEDLRLVAGLPRGPFLRALGPGTRPRRRGGDDVLDSAVPADAGR